MCSILLSIDFCTNGYTSWFSAFWCITLRILKRKYDYPAHHGNVTNFFLIHYPPCIKRILYKELYIISLISFPSPISLIWFSWTNFIQWHFARVFINSKENEIQIAEKRKSTETFFKMRCFPTNSLECIIFKTIP